MGAIGFGNLCQDLEGLKNGGNIEQAQAIKARLVPLLTQITQVIDMTTNLVPAPAQPTPAPEPGPQETAGGEVAVRKKLRFMVIDDEPFQLDLISQNLREIGITDIRTETDGHQALYAITQDAPDVLVCDLGLPGMDGIVLLRLVAEHGYTGGVVIMTGLDAALMHAAESLVKAHGMKLLGSMRKPVEKAALQAIISRLDESNARPAAPKKMPPSGSTICVQAWRRTAWNCIFSPSCQCVHVAWSVPNAWRAGGIQN